MSSSDPQQRLRDILENIERIRSYIGAATLEQFLQDIKTQDAVQRCLERASEAARKIGDRLDDKYPDVAFLNLRQLGSVFRHNYDDVNPHRLWQSLTQYLDPLEKACRAELARIPQPGKKR